MKQNYTDIIIVLDRSGSMQSVKTDTIGGFNRFLEDQQMLPGEARITLAQFDDEYETVLNAVPIKDAKSLNDQTYVPRGNTPLHGAIGRTIEDTGRRFHGMQDHDRPEKVVFLIITDGEENSTHKYEWSKPWSASKVKEMIERQTSAYKWHFVYIGANQDAIVNAAKMGIAASNALNYTSNAEGTQKLYRSASANLCALRTNKSDSMSWSKKDREDQEQAK